MSLYRKEKFCNLLETKEWSDCTFIIDDEKIKAHKFLLACTSPVFESMFYGDMASKEIIIVDIEATTFCKTLEYIYTDKINIESVLEAWNLIYVSQKYFLCELQKFCLDYIKDNLSINNLLLSYEYSKLYNQKALMDRCLDDILMFTRGVLLFSSYHMQANTLIAILKANRGSMTDMVMLAMNWGLEECGIAEIAPSKENIYSVFKKSGVVNELQFKDFDMFYNQNELKPLTKEQKFAFETIVDLCEQFYLDCLSYSPSLYAKKRIQKNNMQFKYRTEYKCGVNLPITHNELLSPTVNCNKDCLVFGVAVSTKSKSMQVTRNHYIGGANIYIYVRHNNNLSHLIYEHEDQRHVLEYNDVQKIVFPVPVLFEAHKQYMICVEYVSEMRDRESVLLVYLFDKLYKNKNETTVIRFNDEFNGSVLRGLCFYEA